MCFPTITKEEREEHAPGEFRTRSILAGRLVTTQESLTWGLIHGYVFFLFVGFNRKPKRKASLFGGTQKRELGTVSVPVVHTLNGNSR